MVGQFIFKGENMEIIDYLTKTNYKKKSSKKNKYIIIHYTANDGDTAWGNCHYFYEEYRGASANYFVDEKSIYRCVKDEDVAWGVNQTWNNQSIHIELCSRNTKKDKSGAYYFLEETVENAIWLTKELMAKWGIPVENVLRHFDCTRKIVPKTDGRRRENVAKV